LFFKELNKLFELNKLEFKASPKFYFVEFAATVEHKFMGKISYQKPEFSSTTALIELKLIDSLLQ
jgi:hypothetical protein